MLALFAMKIRFAAALTILEKPNLLYCSVWIFALSYNEVL